FDSTHHIPHEQCEEGEMPRSSRRRRHPCSTAVGPLNDDDLLR
uniref:Uncharacterized protein n=1 Tax=Aegilops tauschii subsp. strangulata TaxID=200361 RepID=A0A453MZD5_AEGTS